MKNSRSSPLGLYVIGIAALFLAGFLMLVIFGAQTYQDTVRVQNDNSRSRASLSYITASVRAFDAAGAVYVSETLLNDGTSTVVLNLLDGDTGYAQRIYCRDGQLMEEYARVEAELLPDASSAVAETEVFEAEIDGSILRVRTDDGEVLIHLRAQ